MKAETKKSDAVREMVGSLWCCRTVLALLALCLLAVPQHAAAQAIYGSIFGTVTDSTGAVIPNATITVIDVAKGTSVSVQSDPSGEYRVQHLIPDTYSVTAELTGFGKVTTQNVVVYADTAPKVDITLAVGSVTNEVTVTSAAPLLQTEHTDVNVILNERAVETLPNLNRNFTAFELLTPGTTYIGWGVDESQNPQRSQQIEVNGQLPFATGYELDGTDNQDPVIGIAVINPNLDAVSEMKVTSQNYDAEFGKAVAGLVTAQTKSGSDNFHGSAFEFYRSDAFQARDPFSQSKRDPITGKYIPTNTHNQFGGSIGGPIIKNKLFFFGDYQGLREKNGISGLFSVPSNLQRTSCLAAAAAPANPALTCDLSQYLLPQYNSVHIYDPTSGDANSPNPVGDGRTAYSNNQIPGSALSAPAINLLKLLPAPNTGSADQLTGNYAASGTGSFHNNQFDVRVDDRFSDKLHLFGRYTFFNSDLSGGSVFGAAGGSGFGTNGFAGTDTSRDHSLTAGGDYTLSPQWLADFRFGWFRFHFNELQPEFNQPLGTNLGIPGVNTGDLNLNGGLPQFNIDGLTTYGVNTAPFLQTENSYQINNNWSHSVGHHNIKFGADVRRATEYAVGLDNNNFRSGNFHFPASITGSPDQNSPGVGLATFLLGDVGAFQRTQTANTSAASHQWRAFYFAQDQWRVTSTVTLSYGLRWEWYFPEAADGKGQGGLLDLNTGNVRIAGYGPYNDSLNVEKSWTKFAPRIGISWQARPNTVVRTGYGRVYGQGWSGNTFGEVLSFTYPIQVSQNLNQTNSYFPTTYPGSTTQLTLANGPPAYNFAPIPASGNYPLPDGVSVPTRPLEVRLPTLDAWNLAIQQEINKSMALQIAYVGSHGIHNMFDSSNQFDPNQPTLNGFNQINPATGLTYTENDRRPFFDGIAQTLGVNYGHPFLWTQGLRYNANEATSSYNALQVKLEKRFSHGVQFLSHYTWSRAMSHESYYFGINPRVGYGASYYNRPQAFVLAGNWDLPVGKGKALGGNSSRALDYLIGGYAINGTVTVEAGLPYTPGYALCSQDNDTASQYGGCRPSQNGSAYQLGAGKFRIDPNFGPVVPYFTPSPYELGGSNCGPSGTDACPTSFGPYVRPAPGTFGNIYRDSLYGPGLVNTDLSISKKFFVREGMSAAFRADAFNLFNKANLNQPNSCVDCGGTSGLITGTIGSQDGTSMRRLQFSVRFEF
jgi:outer membrane receptor protein involved in Fe transport